MQASAEKIWAAAQQHLRSMLSADTYNLWFAPLRASALDGRHASSSKSPMIFAKSGSRIITWACSRMCRARRGPPDAGQIQSRSAANALADARAGRCSAPQSQSRPKPPAERIRITRSSSFNPKNTFDTFVVGNNNNFAHAAALAVAQAPGKSYNPLFLYGGVGLGKTHLLHAIGQHVAGSKKGARVAYVSSEKFTNEYIDAIQNNQLVSFRKKYRQTDVLLIDDIQFLAGKERIQEEFFHTFNALHEAHKQIVLTCDRPASEIQNLEQRLVSRFEWGLVTDLQPPDIEMRLAILQQEGAVMGVELPEEIMNFLAQPHPHQHPPAGRRADPRRLLRLADRQEADH